MYIVYIMHLGCSYIFYVISVYLLLKSISFYDDQYCNEVLSYNGLNNVLEGI